MLLLHSIYVGQEGKKKEHKNLATHGEKCFEQENCATMHQKLRVYTYICAFAKISDVF